MTASMMGAVTVSANDSGVESIDDLAGKKIGVQLGTTGDTYVTDEYEAMMPEQKSSVSTKQMIQ